MAALLLMFSISSCEPVIDEDATDFGTGPNLVGFAAPNITVSAVADGGEYTKNIPVRIIGPRVGQMNDEVTVEIAIAEGSTAEEGLHFMLPSTTVTLNTSEDNGDVYEGTLPITVITEGVEAPLQENPILKLVITDVSSDAPIVVNDKTENVSVNLKYRCPFDISQYAGTFIATTDEFGIYLGEPQPFEVVVGPGENQITLVNLADHPEEYDLVVDVDPETGALTIPKQVALNYNNFGATQYGELSMEGTGYSDPGAGACIGEFGYTAAYTVGAGSFGQFGLAFERVQDTAEGEETEE